MGYLVLKRRTDQSLTVRVRGVTLKIWARPVDHQVQIGIEAPAEVEIWRTELGDRP